MYTCRGCIVLVSSGDDLTFDKISNNFVALFVVICLSHHSNRSWNINTRNYEKCK